MFCIAFSYASCYNVHIMAISILPGLTGSGELCVMASTIQRHAIHMYRAHIMNMQIYHAYIEDAAHI